uniref:Response regulatory domain-containing protein n=1 Tax=Virgibacillus oceani TaxID=1479511 RepID=A0A917HST8_9BACI|nr:response regulator [Virgibacillus oceani]GGG88899.1 hypothetical protein GCM10011398_38590 [Virgibacillus oceani]
MVQSAILIVEDEQKLSRVLQLELEYENYKTEIAGNGKDALRLMEQKEWDLVLLDIMLPELSGLEVLRRVRRNDDRLIYEVEIYSKTKEADMEIDAYTGEIIAIEIDHENY